MLANSGVVLISSTVGISGCGATMRRSQSGRAAEPAVSPVASTAPAGRLIAVGGQPEGIDADSRTHLVAVGLREPARLALIDSRSGVVLRDVALPGAPRHLQLARSGGPVLVPAEDAGELVRVSLPDGKITIAHTLRQPHDAAEVAGRVFVGNEYGSSVSVLSGNRTVARLGGLLQPGGVAADRHDVAVIDVRSNLLSLYDAHTLRLIGRVPAGSGPTHVVSDGGRRIYVIDTRGNAVGVFSSASGLRRLTELELPGTPYGVAIDRERRRLWVTLTARNELVELSLAALEPHVVARYPTARQPNTVAVDQSDGRVFVADRTAGVVQVIEPPPDS